MVLKVVTDADVVMMVEFRMEMMKNAKRKKFFPPARHCPQSDAVSRTCTNSQTTSMMMIVILMMTMMILMMMAVMIDDDGGDTCLAVWSAYPFSR